MAAALTRSPGAAAAAGLTGPGAGSTAPGTRASPGAASRVEAGPGQPGTGDAGPVGATACGVGGVEPLPEELVEPAAARRAAGRQPPVEARFELGLGDGAVAVAPLDAHQRPGEARMAQDLAQGDVGDARAVIGR